MNEIVQGAQTVGRDVLITILKLVDDVLGLFSSSDITRYISSAYLDLANSLRRDRADEPRLTWFSDRGKRPFGKGGAVALVLHVEVQSGCDELYVLRDVFWEMVSLVTADVLGTRQPVAVEIVFRLQQILRF